MLYLITYTYTQPATGQSFPGLHYIQSADSPQEARYFFECKYKHSLIDITNMSEVE